MDIKLWITERIQSLRDVFAEGWVAAKKSNIIPLDHKSIHQQGQEKDWNDHTATINNIIILTRWHFPNHKTNCIAELEVMKYLKRHEVQMIGYGIIINMLRKIPDGKHEQQPYSLIYATQVPCWKTDVIAWCREIWCYARCWLNFLCCWL